MTFARKRKPPAILVSKFEPSFQAVRARRKLARVCNAMTSEWNQNGSFPLAT